MKIAKTIAKIIFYISLSVAALYGVIAYNNYAVITYTSQGSALITECKLSVLTYANTNKIDHKDQEIRDLDAYCNGITRAQNWEN